MEQAAIDLLFRSCAFQVEIHLAGEQGPLVRAAFSECDGLEMSMDIRTLRQGGDNFRQVRLVGPTSFGTLTLKRGMTADFGLWRWFSSYAQLEGMGARANVVVVIQNLALEGGDGQERQPLACFYLLRCLPQRLKAPALNAREGVVAIEECQIAYESLRLVGPGEPPPGEPPWTRLTRAKLVLLAEFGKDGEQGASLISSPSGGGGGDLSSTGTLEVQFNPETLRFAYQNELKPAGSEKASDSKESAGIQHIGVGATKLTVALVFDATAGSNERYGDARAWTSQIVALITPRKVPSKGEEVVPPAVRFEWGQIWFEGAVESVEETLELFSPDGRVLRASVALTLVQQRVQAPAFDQSAMPSGALPQLGTRPLTPVPEGATVQSLVQSSGGGDWAAVARSNGVENPRRLPAGTLLDLSPQKGG